eukprot:TRINITY_DN6380_c0_g1_i1.p1 TRINITY_DN6380_c0_g1~~TRINITY_DN6380_c0_g1_i1.p1  ORF type:complete len:560 (-),score=69.68 TRINITY_DN6380_c0_g1_i1:66-1745(-)
MHEMEPSPLLVESPHHPHRDRWRGKSKRKSLSYDDWITIGGQHREEENELINSISRIFTVDAKNQSAIIHFRGGSIIRIDEDLRKCPIPLVNTDVSLIESQVLIFSMKQIENLDEFEKEFPLPITNNGSEYTSTLPLTMIAKFEPMPYINYTVEIILKNLGIIRLRFPHEFFSSFLETVKKQTPKPIALCENKLTGNSKSETLLKFGWNQYDWNKEFDRQKFDTQNWKICTANKDFSICDTYPARFIVPASITDEGLREAAKFRSKGRIPVVCWQHPINKSTLSRCSQPMVGGAFGLWGGRSDADQKLIQLIREADCPGKKLYIIDCRSRVNAYANTYKGAGTETIVDYSQCEIMFMNIENIHRMRDAFTRISDACTNSSSDNNLWQASSDWSYHTNTVLLGACKIVKILHEENCSVLVHCSDGWDRTSQLCALAQLMMDPYYRTIAGFQNLIEKEWRLFGHKFTDRCGHKLFASFFTDRESSPIFLQFMDCVWHIFNAFPSNFEFNEKYLLTIMDNVYSCRFGTFLFDNEKERKLERLNSLTNSLWDLLNSDDEKKNI